MNQGLRQRVRHVARQARRLVQLHSCGWFLATVCLAALGLGALDYVVRWEDVGIRFISWALWWYAACWAAYRFLRVAWQFRCSDLYAASRIEQAYPELRHRLSSAVAFAAESAEHESIDSTELRRAVIADVERCSAPLDFARCLDWRPPVRAWVAAGIPLCTLAMLFFWQSPTVALAAKRLLLPWQYDPWPRRHVLQWEEAPTRLAVGQDFEVRLTDARGDLPEHVEIQYWFDGDDATQVQVFQMQPWGRRLAHRLANVTRPFRYRASGGDDDTMPWTELTLVEPPRIVEQEVILHPPEYLRRDAQRASGSFRAVMGTRAALFGHTNKPLAAAWLETDTCGSGITLPLELAHDQLGYSLPDHPARWTIDQSGRYAIRLVAQDGLDVGVVAAWDVEAVRDMPPTASLRRPATDLMVTPVAELPLQAIVKDDFAVQAVELRYVRATALDQAEQVIPLRQGTDADASPPAEQPLDGEDGVQRAIEHLWDLTEIAALKPGEWIDFRVVAIDSKQQVGESTPRRLTCIAAEDLEERLSDRQSELLAQLGEILNLQRETRTQTAELEIQARETSVLERRDVDQLQVVELDQRQIQQRLGHPDDGLAAKIAAIVEDARINRLDNPDLLARLAQLSSAVRDIDETCLAPIQYHLVGAVKTAREVPVTDAEGGRVLDESLQNALVQAFHEASLGQQRVIDTIQQLLAQLARWDNYQRLAREVGRLRRDQEDIYRRTQQLRVETLTKQRNQLNPQQRAGIKRLNERQNDVALRFTTLATAMETARQELASSDPSAATVLTDALESIRQSALGGAMRDVAREIDGNRLSQAAERQEVVLEQLEQLQDLLANRRERQLERRARLLRDSLDTLDQIHSGQEQISKETADAAAASTAQFEQWRQRETELAVDVERVTRQLQRGTSGDLPETLADTRRKLVGASEAAGAGDLPGTRQQALEALHTLAQARQQLRTALGAVEADAETRRGAYLLQSLQGFLSRQQRLRDETAAAEERRSTSSQTPLDSPWIQLVERLAQEQAALCQELADVTAACSDAIALAFALEQASLHMTAAAQHLRSQDTARQTLDRQERAMDYLRQVLTVLQQKEMETPSEPSPTPSEETAEASRRAVPLLLAQLRLIRLLQEQVNRETQLLEQVELPWEPPHVQQYEQLLTQQQRLATLVSQLLADSVQEQPVETPSPQPGLDAIDQAPAQEE